jgi:hypothetical protein
MSVHTTARSHSADGNGAEGVREQYVFDGGDARDFPDMESSGTRHSVIHPRTAISILYISGLGIVFVWEWSGSASAISILTVPTPIGRRSLELNEE